METVDLREKNADRISWRCLVRRSSEREEAVSATERSPGEKQRRRKWKTNEEARSQYVEHQKKSMQTSGSQGGAQETSPEKVRPRYGKGRAKKKDWKKELDRENLIKEKKEKTKRREREQGVQ